MENELIIKKNKKGKLHIIISAIILLIGLAFIGFGVMNANDKKNNAQNLVEFGWNNSTTDELVYLDITYEPVQLTEEIDGEAYYILLDNDYYYIAYMKLDKAEKIKAPARVTGITATPETDVKRIAIETMNDVFEDDNILLSDYEEIFGMVYIDTIYSFYDLSPFAFTIGIFVSISGAIALAINLANNSKFNKSIKDIKDLNPSLYERIMNEMNNPNKYYKEINLVVTNNYLISLNSNKFEALDYQDMIWIYKYEYRYNGARTNENLKVQTKDGIIHDMAIANGSFRKADDYYQEIMQTVHEKNGKVLLGYTQDNVNLANSMIGK